MYTLMYYMRPLFISTSPGDCCDKAGFHSFVASMDIQNL